jgi:hypothetical protein
MDELNRRPTFLLRLPVSLREEAMKLAREEGTSLNHFITIAIAEKLVRNDAMVAHRNEQHRLIRARPALHHN